MGEDQVVDGGGRLSNKQKTSMSLRAVFSAPNTGRYAKQSPVKQANLIEESFPFKKEIVHLHCNVPVLAGRARECSAVQVSPQNVRALLAMM